MDPKSNTLLNISKENEKNMQLHISTHNHDRNHDRSPSASESSKQNSDDNHILSNLSTIVKSPINLVYDTLNQFVSKISSPKPIFGYPENQLIQMEDFYKWYSTTYLCNHSCLNNAGDPTTGNPYMFNTHKDFERLVVKFFSDLYNFEQEQHWGIITASGSDGNNGIFFGIKHLCAMQKRDGLKIQKPIVYAQKDAHYSIRRIADVQGLTDDGRYIEIDVDNDGKMSVDDLKMKLNPNAPALILIAIGTTVRGAIDSQEEIDAVLKTSGVKYVYRHLDTALAGGFLPFLDRDIINQRRCHFDSIAVSGHKFFGFDEPMGVLITTRDVRDDVELDVDYLGARVPTITCSRSGLAAIKFWWRIQMAGTCARFPSFEQQARTLVENAKIMRGKLLQIPWLKDKVWLNENANTVYFARPPAWVMAKWSLAPFENGRLIEGGKLAHVVVMQHVTVDVIEEFVEDMQACGGVE